VCNNSFSCRESAALLSISKEVAVAADHGKNFILLGASRLANAQLCSLTLRTTGDQVTSLLKEFKQLKIKSRPHAAFDVDLSSWPSVHAFRKLRMLNAEASKLYLDHLKIKLKTYAGCK
jgi:hypothetical protein